MGRGGGVTPVRPPSQTAYYVALGGIAVLLLMLCCYFLHYCYTKLNELSEHASLCGGAPSSSAATAPPARPRVSYPVQTVVRDSATAMAKLCKDLPQHSARAGDTVFPTTPPAAVRLDMGAVEGNTNSGDHLGTGVSPGAGDHLGTGLSPGAGDDPGAGGTSAEGEGARGGSVASGSEAATLSDDTATTGASDDAPPPAEHPAPVNRIP